MISTFHYFFKDYYFFIIINDEYIPVPYVVDDRKGTKFIAEDLYVCIYGGGVDSTGFLGSWPKEDVYPLMGSLHTSYVMMELGWCSVECMACNR